MPNNPVITFFALSERSEADLQTEWQIRVRTFSQGRLTNIRPSNGPKPPKRVRTFGVASRHHTDDISPLPPYDLSRTFRLLPEAGHAESA
jgi:hypothetical protein